MFSVCSVTLLCNDRTVRVRINSQFALPSSPPQKMFHLPLYGKLANPDMRPIDDPRYDPRLAAAT